ncbi:hypothetical protein AJ79_06679 [Helicocarpus griseus UAMH5409]|uniref:Uncharacterized protein n=1 Tax=Helicocarpus griseus UAMH5409 TaxID=1447875 RepID=A0A2B7XB14_9EURO|nr:hypothetical protein AJ79_06679 [Helicocarpus griseus UAMH5409]
MMYQESDDHATRRSQKRRKLSAQSSVSTVSSIACTEDASPTALINDKKSRNPTKKYCKNLASNSHCIPAAPQDDMVTSCLGEGIPVCGFLLSHLSGSKVCYTITFYHEETASGAHSQLSKPSLSKENVTNARDKAHRRLPYIANEVTDGEGGIIAVLVTEILLIDKHFACMI